MSRRKKSKSEMKKEVLENVKKLFNEAEQRGRERKFALADRYVKLARRSAMSVNLTLPRELKRKFCKHCYSYLVPGKNCRVRIGKSRVIYYCHKCKKFMRFVIGKKRRV